MFDGELPNWLSQIPGYLGGNTSDGGDMSDGVTALKFACGPLLQTMFKLFPSLLSFFYLKTRLSDMPADWQMSPTGFPVWRRAAFWRFASAMTTAVSVR
jgi:hypothetical protein